MLKKFKINFPQSQPATAIEIFQDNELEPGLSEIGLLEPKVTIAIVGGAGKFEPEEMQEVAPFLSDILLPIIQKQDCYLVDGGTDAGIMRMIGRLRSKAIGKFPLIGVAARETVILENKENNSPDAAPLEPNHSHFILVPGSRWGDESPWISRVVSLLSKNKAAVTLLINGGEISREDVRHSIDANRLVVALAGSGRLADELEHLANKPDLLKIINLNDSDEKIRHDFESILLEAKDE